MSIVRESRRTGNLSSSTQNSVTSSGMETSRMTSGTPDHGTSFSDRFAESNRQSIGSGIDDVHGPKGMAAPTSAFQTSPVLSCDADRSSGHRVEVGSLDHFVAGYAKVVGALIIGDDQHDIRTVSSEGHRREKADGKHGPVPVSRSRDLASSGGGRQGKRSRLVTTTSPSFGPRGVFIHHFRRSRPYY